MSLSPRLIRRRIKSVTNTRKITKAMELVDAAKMRKAVAQVQATRPYAEASWRAIQEMAKVTDPTLHPLLRAHKNSSGAALGSPPEASTKGNKALVVLYSSDRGLCGGYNSQLVKQFMAFAGKRKDSVDIVAIGRKGQDQLRRRGFGMVAAFTGMTTASRMTDMRPIADLAITDFTAGKYDAVYLAFTDFRSALTQVPMVRQVLPIVRIEGLGEVNVAGGGSDTRGAVETPAAPLHRGLGGRTAGPPDGSPDGWGEFLFEPSPEAVLDTMLPRLVETQFYQALLESLASEHSARMLAMRSATDAASDMIDDLTLTFNQARQTGITREIAEISSGKAALEK